MGPAKLPQIAVTMGDPAGIGPEIIAASFKKGTFFAKSRAIVIGDHRIIERGASRCGLDITINVIKDTRESLKDRALNILDISGPDPKGIAFGRADDDAARGALSCIDRAVELAIKGEVSAIVTCPVNKNSVSKVSPGFRGHTEYIAEKTRAGFPVMLLMSRRMKVVPLSTHTSVRSALDEVTHDRILRTLKILDQGLKSFFGIKKPSIAVSGLNPHAGEDIFGTEEEEIIRPAIMAARSLGIDASGPWPPDTVYASAYSGRFDAVLGMYHDQALIPVKLGAFPKVANVTLGIPIIRTSPGHGVAYDIAGKGKADPAGLDFAYRTAVLMVLARNKRGVKE